MDSTTAREQVRRLAGWFTGPDGKPWTDWLPVWSWARDLMGRLLVLVGDEEVIWASGAVEDADGTGAYLVLFTAGAFVEGGFSRIAAGAAPEVWLRATGWQVIQRVRVASITPLADQATGPWPRHVDAYLDVDRGSGPRPILLPVAEKGVAALVAFLPRLTAALTASGAHPTGPTPR